MSRKKATPPADAPAEHVNTNAGESATAVAEADGNPLPPVGRPGWVDGPPTTADGRSPLMDSDGTREEPPRNWGDPYKPIFSGRGFELGEHRQFKQRVFRFSEKPDEQVLATLKDAGFTYRANEKAWTIPANADTRKMTDDLAREWAGPGAGMSR